MFEFIGYFGAVLMGFALGLLGGGGSILSVPIFVYLFGVTPVVATGYSLFVVGMSALIGGLRYLRQGLVDHKVGIVFSAPSFIAVFSVRKYLVPALPDVMFHVGSFAVTKDTFVMVVFAIVMLAAATSMIHGRKERPPLDLPEWQRYAIIALQGFFVASVTAFVGAGGGFLIVPALVVLARLPMKTAVGTSLLIIAANSLIGFIGDVTENPDMDWWLLTTFAATSLVGIFVGMAASKKVTDKSLKKGFGYFVLCMGVFIIYKQIAG